MNITFVAVLVVFVAMYIGPGCGRPTVSPPPRPPRSAEIVYIHSRGKYVLSPEERNAVMDIILSNPTLTFADIPIDLSAYQGTLHVAGQYGYGVDYGSFNDKESGQISVSFQQGQRQTVYVWRGDRILPLAKRLCFATTDREIQDAFAAFVVQQVPTTDAGKPVRSQNR